MIDRDTRRQAVLDVLVGRATAGEIAERHGVAPAEIETWKQLYLEGLADASERRPARRPGRPAAIALLVAMAALSATGLVVRRAMASTCSPPAGFPAGLTPFCADTPALASEVNGNFQKVIAYLEQKVGAYDKPELTVNGDITTTGSDSDGASGAVVIHTNADTMVLDGNEVDSNSASGLELQKNNPSVPVIVYSSLNVSGALSVSGAPGLKFPLRAAGTLPCDSLARGAIAVFSTSSNDQICVCGNKTGVLGWHCLLSVSPRR